MQLNKVWQYQVVKWQTVVWKQLCPEINEVDWLHGST